MIELLTDRYAYWAVLGLLAIGLYGILVMGNLVKKLVGLVLFSSASYLFFIHGSLLEGAATPIIDEELGTDPSAYVDPLPHLLILTAIVVGAGVLGVGLSLLVRIYQAHGTFDEAEVAAQLADGATSIGVRHRPHDHDDTGARDEDAAGAGDDPRPGADGPGRT